MDTTPDYKEALELVKLRMKEDGVTVKEAVAEYARLVGIASSQALRDVGRQLLDYSYEIKAPQKALKKLVLKAGLIAITFLPEEYKFIIAQCDGIVKRALELGYTIDQVTAFNAWTAYDLDYNVPFSHTSTTSDKQLERILLHYCHVVE